MAQKINVSLVDDVDGSVAQETVTFSIDGVAHEIDLNAENADRLRATFAPYVAAARRVGGRRVRSAPAAGVGATAPAAQSTVAPEAPAPGAAPAAVFSAAPAPAATKKAVKQAGAKPAKKTAPKGAKKVSAKGASPGRRQA